MGVAGAAGAAGVAGPARAVARVGGLVQMVVVVTAAVVEPMLIGCFVIVEVEVLYCLIGVTRGAQGSRFSLCGLPGPVGSITTDEWQSAGSGSSPSSVSGSSYSSADPSLGVTLVSVM